jgi:hypothetical protein
VRISINASACEYGVKGSTGYGIRAVDGMLIRSCDKKRMDNGVHYLVGIHILVL